MAFEDAQLTHAVHALFWSQFFQSILRDRFEDEVFETRMLTHQEGHDAVDRGLHLRRGEGLADGEVALFAIERDLVRANVGERFDLRGFRGGLVEVGIVKFGAEIEAKTANFGFYGCAAHGNGVEGVKEKSGVSVTSAGRFDQRPRTQKGRTATIA